VGPESQKLSSRLSKLEKLLITQGEQYWAAWVRRSNDEIRNGDFHGVESFLGALGGMGSLNDVVCSDNDATAINVGYYYSYIYIYVCVCVCV